MLVRLGVGIYQERLLIEQQQGIPSAVMSEVPLTKSTKFDSEKSIDFSQISVSNGRMRISIYVQLMSL